jgi:hypothetical protein
MGHNWKALQMVELGRPACRKVEAEEACNIAIDRAFLKIFKSQVGKKLPSTDADPELGNLLKEFAAKAMPIEKKDGKWLADAQKVR